MSKAMMVNSANDASLDKIRSDWSEILALGNQLESDKIRFVNLGREVGLALQGLCKHEQMKLSFFENIKEHLPETLTFAAVQKCIHLANALPDPVKTLEEARPGEDQLLLAGGFIAAHERAEQQTGRETTPEVFVFNTFAHAKNNLIKRMERASEWDEPTKESILEHIALFEKLLADLRKQLEHLTTQAQRQPSRRTRNAN